MNYLSREYYEDQDNLVKIIAFSDIVSFVQHFQHGSNPFFSLSIDTFSMILERDFKTLFFLVKKSDF